MIRAIETVYNGYRFRSRLEARWAVFFDAMGIRYEYEAEGYDLGALGWYLPDFWLPDAKWHVEIKPDGVNPRELEKARYLDNYPPDDSLGAIVLVGPPEIPFHANTYDESGTFVAEVFGGSTAYVCSRALPDLMDNLDALIQKIEYAVNQARSARFQRGGL